MCDPRQRPLIEILTEAYAPVLDRHRDWLDCYPSWRRDAWERQLEREETVEGAIFEALVVRALQAGGAHVEPAEDRKSGGPDFLCGNSRSRFYVESTVLTIAATSDATGLDHLDLHGDTYGMAAGRLRQAIAGKVRQARKADGLPVLVAVGTLHLSARLLCFGEDEAQEILTGEPRFVVPINNRTGKPIGPLQTGFRADTSAFVVLGIDPARPMEAVHRPVSGVLVLGKDATAVEASDAAIAESVTGLLHPDPVRPFDRSLLPGFRFYALADGWQNGKVEIRARKLSEGVVIALSEGAVRDRCW